MSSDIYENGERARVGDIVIRSAHYPSTTIKQHAAVVTHVSDNGRTITTREFGGGWDTDRFVLVMRQQGVPKRPEAPTPPPAADPVKAAEKFAAELVATAIAKKEADDAAAALHEAAVAVQNRISTELKLADATSDLLKQVRRLIGGEVEVPSMFSLAEFRKELQPLAATYGFKIVLVGDKTKATLTKVQ